MKLARKIFYEAPKEEEEEAAIFCKKFIFVHTYVGISAREQWSDKT